MSAAATQATEWMCNSCGFVYEESKGWPEFEVAPGTAWADVHDDFTCPDCGARKQDFVPLEV